MPFWDKIRLLQIQSVLKCLDTFCIRDHLNCHRHCSFNWGKVPLAQYLNFPEEHVSSYIKITQKIHVLRCFRCCMPGMILSEKKSKFQVSAGNDRDQDQACFSQMGLFNVFVKSFDQTLNIGKQITHTIYHMCREKSTSCNTVHSVCSTCIINLLRRTGMFK